MESSGLHYMAKEKKTRPIITVAGRDEFSRALIAPEALSLMRVIADHLRPRKGQVYVVGGFIRDALLGRETTDIDLAVTGDALEAARGLAAVLKGTFVPLDSENNVARVVLSGTQNENQPQTVDIAAISGTIEEDLERRDFTIDAMALDLREVAGGGTGAKLMDPFHSRDDLDHGIIRTVSDTALSSDPVRLLRAVRLATEIGFRIEAKTADQIRSASGLLGTVPGERVREELLSLLEVGRGGHFLLLLDDLGLLAALFPEMDATRGVSQPAEHHWDVFTHSVMTVSAIDYLLHQGVWEFPTTGVLDAVPWSDVCARHFEKPVAAGSTRRTLLKLAALFHDVAKPQTKAPDSGGRTRFLGHADQGSEIAASILERLRFSVRETRLVSVMVKYHLRPTQMGEPPSHRAIYRYFRDTGDAGIDILYLSLADHLATRGPELIPENWKLHTDTVRYVLEEHFKRESVVPPPKLIDGNDLMDIFGLAPGPRLGQLLEAVKEAHAAGELTNRQEALDYIHNVLSEEKGK